VDMFFLLRWKRGGVHLRESLTAMSFSTLLNCFVPLRSSEWGAYAYFSFLIKDTLVIPNLLKNTLEIFRIVVDEKQQ